MTASCRPTTLTPPPWATTMWTTRPSQRGRKARAVHTPSTSAGGSLRCWRRQPPSGEACRMRWRWWGGVEVRAEGAGRVGAAHGCPLAVCGWRFSRWVGRRACRVGMLQWDVRLTLCAVAFVFLLPLLCPPACAVAAAGVLAGGARVDVVRRGWVPVCVSLLGCRSGAVAVSCLGHLDAVLHLRYALTRLVFFCYSFSLALWDVAASQTKRQAHHRPVHDQVRAGAGAGHPGPANLYGRPGHGGVGRRDGPAHDCTQGACRCDVVGLDCWTAVGIFAFVCACVRVGGGGGGPVVGRDPWRSIRC